MPTDNHDAMNIERSSIIVVIHKPKFIELAKASMRRRLGREYNFPSGEDDMDWIIPNIDDLGAQYGNYMSYIDEIKVQILRYELDTFEISKEEFMDKPSKKVCDELLDLRVYARMFPIQKLLND